MSNDNQPFVPPSMEVEATALGDHVYREAQQMIQDSNQVADAMQSIAKAFPNDSFAQALAQKYERLAQSPEAFATGMERLKACDDPPTPADQAAAELGIDLETYLEG